MAINQEYNEYRVNDLPSSGNPGDRYYLNVGGGKYMTYIMSDGGLPTRESGAEFLEKDTVAELRAMDAREIWAIQNGFYKGVKLNGYYAEGDTPAPIEYYLSDTTEEDDGGSVFEVGGIKLDHDFVDDIHHLYFGIKADGIDETDRFLKYVKYCALNGKKAVLKKDGHIVYNTLLEVDGSLNVEGNNCFVECTSSDTHAIVFKSHFNVLEDLKIKGVYSSLSGDVVFFGSDYNVIRGCKFIGLSCSSIIFSNSNGNKVTECYSENKAFHIRLENSSGNMIYGNTFKGGYRKAVISSNGGWEVEPLGDGIKMTSSGKIASYQKGGMKTVITENVFENVYRDAIDMFSHGEDIIFSYNIIDKAEALGMDIKTIYRDDTSSGGGTSIEGLKQTSKIIVEGNIFNDCGLTYDGAAISILNSELREGLVPDSDKGVYNVLISNNIIREGSRNGIIISSCKNININSNSFTDIPYDSIRVENPHSKNILIGSNQFDINGSDSKCVNIVNATDRGIKIYLNMFRNNDSLSTGIVTSFGTDIELIDNTFEGGIVGLNMFGNGTSSYEIKGNKFRNATTAAIRNNNNTGDVMMFYNIIENCVRGFLIGGTITNLCTSNNKFKSNSTGNYVNLQNVNNYQTLGDFIIT